MESTESTFILFADDIRHLQMANGAHYYPRIVQTIVLKGHPVVFNFHGVPGNDKKDSAERELQSARLREVLRRFAGEKILVGDFNLRPDTEAIRGLEKSMKNLVVESGFISTRTKYYNERESQPFADYAFVTPGITVKEFKVLPDEVSDHAPLFIEFE